MKKKIISILILIALILVVAIIWQWKETKTKYFTGKTNIPGDTTTVVNNIKVNFQFDNDSTFSLQYPYSQADERSLNLLSLTEKLAVQQNWAFATEDYAEMGILVSQIDSKINGQDQKYWQYKINQKTPLISADKYILQIGDEVTWEFRASEL
jgi:hypothetical protein